MIVNTEANLEFLPIPDDLLAYYQDSKSLIVQLLQNLPVMFSDNTVFDANVLNAVKGLGLLAKPTGAKVFFFDGSPNSNKYPHL